MPVTTEHTRTLRVRALPLAVSFLVLSLLSTLAAIESTPVEARDWTREISATRASQLYYESAMRSADAEVKRLKKARKVTQRKLKKAKRRLALAVDRRVAAKRDVRLARGRLHRARLALAMPGDPPAPPPDLQTAVLVLLDPPAAALTTGETDPVRATEYVGFLAISGEVGARPWLATVSVEDVVELERQHRKQTRKFKQVRKRARQAMRNTRVKRNTMASIKRGARAAASRRAGAEAGLASRIVSMSRLAQRRVAKKTSVRPSASGGFVWPTRGRISQSYGCTGFRLNPPRGSCRHFHDGLDIVSYRGSPIRAAAIGVVSYIGWNPWDRNGRAFIVVVAHPGGYETVYGHTLPTRRVRVGQLVRKGEVIGYMGNTGRSTGVHLHFEMRRGHTTLNPLAFL